jgi:hypothetical protein
MARGIEIYSRQKRKEAEKEGKERERERERERVYESPTIKSKA